MNDMCTPYKRIPCREDSEYFRLRLGWHLLKAYYTWRFISEAYSFTISLNTQNNLIKLPPSFPFYRWANRSFGQRNYLPIVNWRVSWNPSSRSSPHPALFRYKWHVKPYDVRLRCNDVMYVYTVSGFLSSSRYIPHLTFYLIIIYFWWEL